MKTQRNPKTENPTQRSFFLFFLEFRGFVSSYNFFTNQDKAISAGALLPEVDIINSHSKQI